MADSRYIIDIVTRSDSLAKTGRRFDRAARSARQLSRHTSNWKKQLKTWENRPPKILPKPKDLDKARKGFQRMGAAINGMGRMFGTLGGGFSRMSGMGWSMARASAQTAANIGMTVGAIGLMAGAAGMGAAIKGAVGFNAELEKANAKIATSLLLYDVFAGRGSPAQMLNMAFGAAGAQTQKEFEIAARSPASYAETTTMSSNMMAGYVGAVGWDAERYNKLLEPLTTLGMLSGDAATFGSQMGRMFSGGAGAESETYRQYLAPVISKEGGERGYFQKGLHGGDLTAAFNALSADKRVQLIEAAAERLGPITEKLAYSWMGLTGTVASVGQVLLRTFGKATFDKLKSRMMAWVAPGGILDPASSMHVERLKQLADSLGDGMARAADFLMDKVQSTIIYVAANWESMLTKAENLFMLVKSSAEVLLKAMVLKGAVGAGIGAVGSVGGLATGMGELAMNLLKLGGHALWIAPILAGMAISLGAIAGAGIAVFAGAVAYFVEYWDVIVKAIANGQIQFAELGAALDTLWAKFVNLGQAFLGSTDPITNAQTAVDMMTNAVEGITSAIDGMLGFAGDVIRFFYTIMALGSEMKMGVLEMDRDAAKGNIAIYDFMAATTGGIVSDQLNRDAWGKRMELNKIEKQIAHQQVIIDKAKENMSGQNWGYRAQAAWREDQAKRGVGGVFSFIKGGIDKVFGKDGTPTPNVPKPPKKTGGANIKIDKVVIHQDLRNHDPDRIVGAFYRDFTKQVMRRTSATTLPDGGS